jgi:hypothetical protein
MQTPTEADGDADEDDAESTPGPSFFHRALESVFELEKRKALLSPSDLVGILVYNTVSIESLTSNLDLQTHGRPCLLLIFRPDQAA